MLLVHLCRLRAPANGVKAQLMTILLPDEGRFREFENSIDAVLVGRILEDIEAKLVELTMPRFEFNGDTLRGIGCLVWWLLTLDSSLRSE